MEANEPLIAYGLREARLEEMRSQIISAIKDMTDVSLLSQCYKLLKNHHSESKLTQTNKIGKVSDRVQSLVGIIPPFTKDEIEKDNRLAYILGK
jgi:hypothetical protein